MSVHIFYTSNKEKYTHWKWQNYLSMVPPDIVRRIRGYRRREDQQNCLTGRLLLKKGLSLLNYPDNYYDAVQISSLGKPYIPGSPVAFNISHSGTFCACALGTSELGMDIEEIKPLDINDFNGVLTEAEIKFIYNSRDSLSSFFTIWTRKEALIKAIGTGLFTKDELFAFCMTKKSIVYRDETWYIVPVDTSYGYIAHIATKSANPSVSAHEIFF